MDMTALLLNQAATGQSTPINVGQIKGSDVIAKPSLTLIIHGITDGSLEVKFGPSSAGPFVLHPDGAISADTVLVTPIAQAAWVLIDVTGATDIDLSVWAG